MIEGTFGLASVIPTLLVVGIAIITKRVMEPLIIGTLAGYMVLSGTGFFVAWVDAVMLTMTDYTTVWTMVIPALFGVLILFFERSGGARAFADRASKYVKTSKSSLIATYVLGIIVFIDEYMNALVVAGTMRTLTDKHKVPREMLAYTTNSTGTPVVVINPFSSWAVFIMGLLGAQSITNGVNIVSFYMKIVPYMFYAIVTLIITMLLIVGLIPKTKHLKKINKRAENGNLFPVESESDESFEKDKDQIKARNNQNPKLINFILPLVTLVGATIAFDMDLIKGLFIAIIVSIVLYIVNKTMTYEEVFNSVIDGIKSMVFLIVFVMFLFLLVRVNEELGFIVYVIETVKPIMIGGLLPAVTFLVIGLMGFTTGSFWGTMAIAIPIIVPLAEIGGVNIYLTLGALISGAVFGSHACFFGDAVLLSSTAAQIKPMDQIRVALPYALTGVAVSTVLYLIFGFIM